jgi:hypothetical protein
MDIYAEFSHLIDCDYVIFMDEDNWIEPNHIEIYYNLIKNNEHIEWLYCLRNIIDQDDEYVCKDMCESLGYLNRVFYTNDDNEHMIDTNCFCVSRNVLIKWCHVWNLKSSTNSVCPDRIFSSLLMEHCKKYVCTFEFTLNYRIASRIGESTTKEFFLQGNEYIKTQYGKIQRMYLLLIQVTKK